MYARKREEGFRPRGYAGYTACSLPPLTTRRVGGWSNTTCARRSASRGYHPRRFGLELGFVQAFSGRRGRRQVRGVVGAGTDVGHEVRRTPWAVLVGHGAGPSDATSTACLDNGTWKADLRVPEDPGEPPLHRPDCQRGNRPSTPPVTPAGRRVPGRRRHASFHERGGQARQPFAPDLSFVQAPAQTCGSAGDYLSRRDPSHQLPHPPFARCQLEGGKLQLGRDSVAFTLQKCAHFLPGFGYNGAIDSALS